MFGREHVPQVGVPGEVLGREIKLNLGSKAVEEGGMTVDVLCSSLLLLLALVCWWLCFGHGSTDIQTNTSVSAAWKIINRLLQSYAAVHAVYLPIIELWGNGGGQQN